MATATGHSVLRLSVRHVVSARAEKQVLWINASSVVATMANKHSIRDLANKVFVRETIGKNLHCFPTSEVLAYLKRGSLHVRAALPLPASIGCHFRNVLEETNVRWSMRRAHGNHSTTPDGKRA